tara:strand:- start:613 stop:831 length:219 start_codon:yes stop_codon:yes gene_type:complete
MYESLVEIIKAYIDEMEFVYGASNAVCKEQDIPLQPGHLLGRIFESSTGAAHFILFQLRSIEYSAQEKDRLT